MEFTEDYDPGFVNTPGFGQSATNPLSPVFYKSLGIVEDLSVYGSIFSSNSISAYNSFVIGDSRFTKKEFEVAVPTTFLKPTTMEEELNVNSITSTDRLIVNGKEYKEGIITARNGTFKVLIQV